MAKKKISYIGKSVKLYSSISSFGALFFLLSVLILGLIQPGYNHFIDTISVLVLGKYGWIQQVNFIILAISFGSLGMGLGLYFYGRLWNNLTIGFLLLSLCVVFVLLFKADPVDRTQVKLTKLHSLGGFIHLSITFIMVIILPFLFVSLIHKLNESSSTLFLGRYTLWVIGINVIFGILWFYCRYNGIGFYIKGIWQKGLALNVLLWMMVMGKYLYEKTSLV